MSIARLVRAETLSVKEREYVLASRSIGARPNRIILRHILPNLLGPVAVYVTLTLPVVILQESFLSFIGLGVNEPLTSLGILVKEGADDMDVEPMGLLVPGAVMVTLLVCLTLIGERLRDRFA